METRTKRTSPAPAGKGLTGLFGHLYIDDPEHPVRRMIQCQFHILHKIDDQRYAVQYFSWLDGSATQVGVYPESVLLGDDVKLYATPELWNGAAEREGVGGSW
jgi:hypothetical protein